MWRQLSAVLRFPNAALPALYRAPGVAQPLAEALGSGNAQGRPKQWIQTRGLRDYPIKPLVKNQSFWRKRKSYRVKKEWNLGIVLEPSEVKSLRARNADLSAAFAAFYKHELFLHQMHIPVWRHGVIGRPETQRVRKLLANRAELKQLEAFSMEKHAHLIPTRVEVGKTGWIKVIVAQCYKSIQIDNRRRDEEREVKRRLREY